MAIALVASTLKQSAGATTTNAINTTGATVLIAAIDYYAPNVSAMGAVSDNFGNTYVQRANQQPSGGSAATRIYVCENPTVGSSHTFSLASGAQPFVTIVFAAFSGAATPTCFDKQVSANGTTSSVSPGSVTPTNNNSLVASCYGTAVSSTGVSGTPSGFTLVNQAAYAGGVAIGGGLFYQVQTTATAVNPTFTGWSGGSGNTSACSVVINSSGGGGVTIKQLATLGVG